MGLFSSRDDRTREEKAVDREQHKAFKDAGNQAAAKLRGDGGSLVHDMINEAVADAERGVSWWRR